MLGTNMNPVDGIDIINNIIQAIYVIEKAKKEKKIDMVLIDHTQDIRFKNEAAYRDLSDCNPMHDGTLKMVCYFRDYMEDTLREHYCSQKRGLL